MHAVLDRYGLVKRARQRRRFTAEGTTLSCAIAPNDLWCADFKGEFKTGDGRYCYPLTVSDQASRMILACEALASTREQPVIETFLRLLRARVEATLAGCRERAREVVRAERKSVKQVAAVLVEEGRAGFEP